MARQHTLCSSFEDTGRVQPRNARAATDKRNGHKRMEICCIPALCMELRYSGRTVGKRCSAWLSYRKCGTGTRLQCFLAIQDLKRF